VDDNTSDYTKELVRDVSDGNPGALKIVMELGWFSDWFKMLIWLRKNKVIGSRLYEIVNDKFHGDSHSYGEVLQRDMAMEKSKDNSGFVKLGSLFILLFLVFCGSSVFACDKPFTVDTTWEQVPCNEYGYDTTCTVMHINYSIDTTWHDVDTVHRRSDWYVKPKQPLRMKIDTTITLLKSTRWDAEYLIFGDITITIDTTYYLSPEQVKMLEGK